ncbi:MAG: cytochrome c [Alphaproteobacteria bacterium]|nr:MAG: cytochrome c [Alphaproteobacteria bacterium]
MVRFAWTYLAIIFALALHPTLSWAGETHAGKAEFGKCAACHLTDGAGVPGSFPPLRSNVMALAETDEGRSYLTLVVLKGMSGSIEVEGNTYFGFMPAIGGSLEDQAVAELLNYIVSEVAPTGQPDLEDDDVHEVAEPRLFTSEEIKAYRSQAAKSHTHKTMLPLRTNALSSSGEESASKGDAQ